MPKLLYGSYSDKQFLDFAKEKVSKECSYTDFIQNIAYSNEFLLTYREKIYKDICLTDDINVLLSQVKTLISMFLKLVMEDWMGFPLIIG